MPSDAEKVKEFIETKIIREELRSGKEENKEKSNRRKKVKQKGVKGRGGGMESMQQLWIIKLIYANCLAP